MKNLDIKCISDYRTELMGIAIIGVLLSHIIGLGQVSTKLLTVPIRLFDNLLYTQGFLFLSGFGLYYSWSKNHSLKSYLKKRMGRLLIPFWVMSIPFYFLVCVIWKSDWIEFGENVSTSYYWLQGNNGMWYISISVMLYALFPLMYKYIFINEHRKGIICRTIIIFAVMECLNAVIYAIKPDYYEKVSIGITQAPIFIIGILFGYFSKMNESVSWKILLPILLSFVCLYGLNKFSVFFHSAMILSLRLLTLVGIALVIEKVHLNSENLILGGVKWAGKYTLELYVLHLHFYGLLLHFHPFGNTDLFGINYMLCEISLAVVLALLVCKPVNVFSHFITKKILK